jgi:hypothetical protein
MFHTVGSRHSIQGFYMDAILNERRIKGEISRRNCWIAWMKFLHALVDVSLLMKEEAAKDSALAAVYATDSERFKSPATPQGRAPPMPPREAPSSPLFSGRALYVEGAIDPRGCPVSVRRSYRASSRSSEHMSSRDVSAKVSFKDIASSLDSAKGVMVQHRGHLTTLGRDELSGQTLGPSTAMAWPPAVRSSAGLTTGPGAFVGRPLFKINEVSTPSGDSVDRSVPMSWTSYSAAEAPMTLSSGDSSRMPALCAVDSNAGPLSADVSEVTPASGGYVTDSSGPVSQEEGFRCCLSEESCRAGENSERMGSGPPDSAATTLTLSTRSNGPAFSPAQALYNVFATTAEPRSPRSEVHVVTPSDNMIHHPPAIATFPVTPSQRPRAMTDRQNQIAASYLRPHGIPNLELSMADIIPMIDFLDAWLDEMKENEWTYDYHKPK